jgi:hypothetical protein
MAVPGDASRDEASINDACAMKACLPVRYAVLLFGKAQKPLESLSTLNGKSTQMLRLIQELPKNYCAQQRFV